MIRSTRIVAALLVGALSVGFTGLAAPAATAKAPAKKVKITLKAAKPVVEKGKTVKLSGKVTPKRGVKGLRLVIQQKIAGNDKWARAGTVTVRKSGKFTFHEKPKTATVRQYRAILHKTGPRTKPAFKKAKSPKVTVAVAEWRALTSSDLVRADGAALGWATVNRNRYQNSVYTYNAGPNPPTVRYVALNLYRECYTVRTAAALTDVSGMLPTDVRVLADGALVNTTHLTLLGVAVPVKVDVTGVFRVQFEIDRPAVESGPETTGAFLSPQALCSESAPD